MSKLTNKTGSPTKSTKLTKKTDVPFVLGFKYPLEKDYTFSEFQKINNHEFQRFLNKVSNMTVQDVDRLYSKKPDKSDLYNGMQVLHYQVTDSFRIHVVIEDGKYYIIRLDPNHRFHS